jgi:hypothetical protein
METPHESMRLMAQLLLAGRCADEVMAIIATSQES